MSSRPCNHWITPSSLDEKTKQELWTGLKALEPKLAEMLQTDPHISELKRAFGATIRFTRDNAARYVREGRRIREEKRNEPDSARA